MDINKTGITVVVPEEDKLSFVFDVPEEKAHALDELMQEYVDEFSDSLKGNKENEITFYEAIHKISDLTQTTNEFVLALIYFFRTLGHIEGHECEQMG